MNVMNTYEFEKDAEHSADITAQNGNADLARLMKAWENKNTKRAAKGMGLSLMAVSLSACGSDDGDGGGGDDGALQTFLLTLGQDNITGTDGDDTFNAPLVSATGSNTGLFSVQSLGDFDVLDGGAGVDTLNARLNFMDGSFFFGAPTISNIEIFNLTAGTVGGGLDLSNSTGYEQLWNVNSFGDVFLINVGENAAIGMDNIAGGTTYLIEYTSSASTEVQNVIANAVSTSAASDPVDLNITTPAGEGFETLNLAVSNTVKLNLLNDAAGMEVFNITGSGKTELVGDDEFPNLVELNSTGYTGDLELDISGSGTLESVLTGVGDDTITAAAANFSADTPATTVDLGAGDNRLILEDTFNTSGDGGTYTGGGVIDQDELSALDFTLAPVSNVQTLELVDVSIYDDASLALEGVGGLETLVFNEFENDGYDFTITGAPETLLISATDEFEMDDGLFTIEGVVDLTVETTGTGDSDVRIDGGLNSATLETLVINAADDAELIVDKGLDALTSVEVNALGDDADVTFENFDGDEFGALEAVTVTAADDAELIMDGLAPEQQTQTFTSTAGALGDPAGEIEFAYVDANGDPQTITVVNEAGGFNGDIDTAENIITAFNALDEFEASYVVDDPVFGFTIITITRVDGGPFPDINLVAVSGPREIVNNGILNEGVDGAGFESLETVVVDAADNADVELTNVYGAFTLDVTAADDATVDLNNTNAISASVTAGETVVYEIVAGDIVDYLEIDEAVVTVDGALHGNPNLATLEVSGAFADITLSDDLTGLMTVDLTGVTTQFEVDAAAADFGNDLGTPGFVVYLIGATSSDWAGDPFSMLGGGDSFIDSSVGNRENFKFTDGDFGTIVIDGFDVGADGDRIDLSDLGFTGEGQLVSQQGTYNVDGSFTIDAAGDDTIILDDAGGPDFAGSIILLDTLADNLTSENYIFA